MTYQNSRGAAVGQGASWLSVIICFALMGGLAFALYLVLEIMLSYL